MQKSLDTKLALLAANSSADVFILADAKDADMGFGIAAPGPAPPGARHSLRTLGEFRARIREIVAAGDIDIMLMSAATSEMLTIDERLFDSSRVTPAVRANDTTDIWIAHSGDYTQQPSLPFRTATIDHIQCGRVKCKKEQRGLGADLGLYSITLNNDAVLDRQTLEHYRAFRCEAESKRFRHFLEVFAPNAPQRPIGDVARFVNDSIVRLLSGITRRGRPLFLKMPYFGPAAMEALRHYDSTLVVGILGGSAGTTRDAFQLLYEAKRYGARAALFGRKINQAEDQIAFIRHLRAVADGDLMPLDATRAYHAHLESKGIQSRRDPALDSEITDPLLLDVG